MKCGYLHKASNPSCSLRDSECEYDGDINTCPYVVEVEVSVAEFCPECGNEMKEDKEGRWFCQNEGCRVIEVRVGRSGTKRVLTDSLSVKP